MNSWISLKIQILKITLKLILEIQSLNSILENSQQAL
jgi:hypothetical protein